MDAVFSFVFQIVLASSAFGCFVGMVIIATLSFMEKDLQGIRFPKDKDPVSNKRKVAFVLKISGISASCGLAYTTLVLFLAAF